jgi:hypothetical protein
VTRARVGIMAEPTSNEEQRAMVVVAYNAREAMATATRMAKGADVAQGFLREGKTLLQAARSHVRRRPADVASARLLMKLADRAIVAADAAIALGGVALSYETGDVLESDFEAKQRHQTHRRFQMATEAARKEAHRFLSELVEVYPDAYDVEED